MKAMPMCELIQAAANVSSAEMLPHAFAQDVVKIGVLHSPTGALAKVSVVDAEALAIDEINTSGGVFGKKIEAACHCTLALLSSSEEVLRHGSPAELLMWARLGLRRSQRSSERMDPADTAAADAVLAHFELRSRESVQGLASGEQGESRVALASSKARLAHLLRVLFDVAPTLLTVEQSLATRRPFVSNLGLHLPEVGRALRGPLAHLWYDAAALHAAAHLRHSTHRFARGKLKPIQMALVGVLEDARVELITIAELPGLRRLWGGFHYVEPAHGGSFVVLILRLARCLLDPIHLDQHPSVARGRCMFFELTDEGRAPERLTSAALREIASLLGNNIGQMRLQFNYREYVVEPTYRDDNASLWLPEEDMPPQVQAVADEVPVPADEATDDSDDIEQDADDGALAPCSKSVASGKRPFDPTPLARLQYPEWDHLVGDYRSAWCSVLESRPMPGDPQSLQCSVTARAALLLLRLERVLRAGRLRERMKLRAQLRGDDLDIDAAVHSAIDRRTHHAPGQKVHQRFDRRERDVAALILLDSSTLTADTLPGPPSDARSGESTRTGRTVLDLAREAALLTTLTLSRAGDRCAIHAFASNGPHEVRYERALDFDEVLGPLSIARQAGVRSHLSTRMGAAPRPYFQPSRITSNCCCYSRPTVSRTTSTSSTAATWSKTRVAPCSKPGASASQCSASRLILAPMTTSAPSLAPATTACSTALTGCPVCCRRWCCA